MTLMKCDFALICGYAQSCLTICDLLDCSPTGYSVHEIFQARILEWLAISHSRAFSDPGIEPMTLVSPAVAGRFFTTDDHG